MMRAVAVMRERYGFTATETMRMPLRDFHEWLEALDDEKEERREDKRERVVNAEAPGECIDPGRIRRILQQQL
jgi:uncharacterized protein (UPF0335 family)